MLDAGKVVYRARIRKSQEPFTNDALKAPPFEKANYGRLNPKYISFLYTGEDKKTAISEVRP